MYIKLYTIRYLGSDTKHIVFPFESTCANIIYLLKKCNLHKFNLKVIKNLKAVNETLTEKYLQYLHYSDIGDLSLNFCFIISFYAQIKIRYDVILK